MSRKNGAKPDEGGHIGHNRFAGLVRRLRLSPGTIIAISDRVIDRNGAEELGNAIADTGIPNCILLVVKDVNQIKVFPEKEMNRVGWFHINALKKSILRQKSTNPDDAEAHNDAGEQP